MTSWEGDRSEERLARLARKREAQAVHSAQRMYGVPVRQAWRARRIRDSTGGERGNSVAHVTVTLAPGTPTT